MSDQPEKPEMHRHLLDAAVDASWAFVGFWLGSLPPGIGFVAWNALSPHGAAAQSPIQLHDVTAQTGVTFRHTDGSSGMRYIMESMSAGLATFDYDGDGLIDIYFLNGRPLKGTRVEGPPPRNHLYRNLGGFRFEDVTQRAGVGDAGYGMGVCIGDYDNDGCPGLYVSNFGPNVLYHNNGDLDDNVHLRKDTTAYRLPNILLRNMGSGRFVDVCLAFRALEGRPGRMDCGLLFDPRIPVSQGQTYTFNFWDCKEG